MVKQPHPIRRTHTHIGQQMVEVENVTPYARDEFNRMLSEREREGVQTYGTTLQTFNGRDPIRDLKEEIIDAWQYICQVEMERNKLKSIIGEENGKEKR